jgi:AcrR family transcriptional regulator
MQGVCPIDSNGPATVVWRSAPSSRVTDHSDDGLRERKKRELRQRLSDTATRMFLERGFDAVKVTDIAAACDVSEKTVYNYFPTKEMLVLDRWDGTFARLQERLAAPDVDPVDAVVTILEEDLDDLVAWLSSQGDRERAVNEVLRFGTLLATTPALRTRQRETADRLTAFVARLLAARLSLAPDAPEVQILAIGLIGLWTVHFQSLRRHLAASELPGEFHRRVRDDIARAATTLQTGFSQALTE